jgi:NADH dehydrogenase
VLDLRIICREEWQQEIFPDLRYLNMVHEINGKSRKTQIVILGGGFAGVETARYLDRTAAKRADIEVTLVSRDNFTLARESLPHYGRVDPREVRVFLIGGKAILPELGEELGLYAQEKLQERQAEIKLGAKVIAYAEGAVRCSDGEAIPTETLVWAAGVSPSPIPKDIPCELRMGRVVVNSTLEVPGAPGVWAVGYCAAIIDPTSKRRQPSISILRILWTNFKPMTEHTPLLSRCAEVC